MILRQDHHTLKHLWAKMPKFHVGGKTIEGVDLLKRRQFAWRLDVWPFAVLYLAWMFIVVPTIDITDALIVFGGLVISHILVLLFTAWSVDFRCSVQFNKVITCFCPVQYSMICSLLQNFQPHLPMFVF